MSTPVTSVDAEMVADLRRTVKGCSERGLSVASKWASELLLSIPPAKRNMQPLPGNASTSTFSTSTPARSHSRSPRPSLSFAPNSPQVPSASNIALVSRHPHAPPLHAQPDEVTAWELGWEAREEDLLAAAKSYFDAREFLRAVHVLQGCNSSKARFISLYSQFMASEKKALREWHKLDSNRNQPPVPMNASLLDLLEMVRNVTDPWLLFLRALFCSRLSRREEAIESAILSIAGCPWNWSTWILLSDCIGDGDELLALLPLMPIPPTHPLVQMLQIKILNELHSPSENEVALCDRLLSEDFFPGSLWIMSLRACSLYHLHDYTPAVSQFEKVLAKDPYRIDDIDVFSNILYVTENRLRLSKLAHEFLALDKDRPEVCCLVGNHYSLRAEHEKAVKYFRRATQLDRTYLSAWTLMGHEYVEMKNSHAAIEAYRRAIDVNRKDYRAWYGLGQAYELLNMQHYALHYYQHATALRPYDVRIWQAQGMCYEEIGRPREAIECLKRALLGADPHEVHINTKIAKLYNDLNEVAEAAAYHRRVVEVARADMRPVQDYAKSSIYVARYHMAAPEGDLELAREYLQRVATSNSEEVTTATEMLKRCKALITARAQAAAAKAQADASI
ncbi:hypothetical protein PLICRDRAFT_695920 [Plicaturopsis crispa FD-325 SS-3]|nr:hypothetical protein PLICRDRAFT_695920 [Plicaturopsis crispa FD-325 SS-3]